MSRTPTEMLLAIVLLEVAEVNIEVENVPKAGKFVAVDPATFIILFHHKEFIAYLIAIGVEGGISQSVRNEDVGI